MITTAHRGLVVPRPSLTQSFWFVVLTFIIVFFFGLSVLELVEMEAFVAPLLWVGFVSWMIYHLSKRAGGVQNYMIDLLGWFLGREVVEIGTPDNRPGEIWFGIQFFGRRHVRWKVDLDLVQTVEWNPGQATAMSGHDQKDWHVCLWFWDESKKARRFKPGQGLHVIGPSRRKELTEVFGLALVERLKSTGVPLVPGEKTTCFHRAE